MPRVAFKEQRLCRTCGTEFVVTGRTQRRKFCSRPCVNKGRTRTDEWKEHMSRRNSGSNNPFYGKTHTSASIEQIRETKLGVTWTDRFGEEEAKVRRENLSILFSGNGNPFFGKSHTEESKRKISMNHSDCRGSNNPMFGQGEKLRGEKNGSWMGGSTIDPYCDTFTESLKTKIRMRDRFTCRVCKKHGFVVHHIDYNKLNACESNLVTLCRSCHAKTNFDRGKWIRIFKND